jgi:hypothetical protein
MRGWAERIRTFKRQVDEALGTSAEFSCTAELFEARSEIVFCEFESSHPSHGVWSRAGLFRHPGRARSSGKASGRPSPALAFTPSGVTSWNLA